MRVPGPSTLNQISIRYLRVLSVYGVIHSQMIKYIDSSIFTFTVWALSLPPSLPPSLSLFLSLSLSLSLSRSLLISQYTVIQANRLPYML